MKDRNLVSEIDEDIGFIRQIQVALSGHDLGNAIKLLNLWEAELEDQRQRRL
jgi:hypothetical protein